MKAKEFRASTDLLGFSPTPLQLAILYNDESQIFKLLEYGKLALDETDKRGWTALHYAATSNKYVSISDFFNKTSDKIIRILLQKYHINPSLPNKDGLLPVHEAAKCGNVQALQAFYECLSPAHMAILSSTRFYVHFSYLVFQVLDFSQFTTPLRRVVFMPYATSRAY